MAGRKIRTKPHGPVLRRDEAGRAWLQFEITLAEVDHGSMIHQTAELDPVGLGGLVYRYCRLADTRRRLPGNDSREPKGGASIECRAGSGMG